MSLWAEYQIRTMAEQLHKLLHPTFNGALITCRHSGQQPNSGMILSTQTWQRHRWPQLNVTVASFSKHTTHSIQWLSVVKRNIQKVSTGQHRHTLGCLNLRAGTFTWWLFLSAITLLWWSVSGGATPRGAGQDRLVQNSPCFSEPATKSTDVKLICLCSTRGISS